MIDDLVNDVYLKLVVGGGSALERFEGEHANSIFKYLGMISANVVRDHFRELNAEKRPNVTESLNQLLLKGELPSHSIDPKISFTLEEVEQVLRKVVGKGRNRNRDILIFELRYYHELTLNEIAENHGFGLSPVSIGSILNRIVSKMRPILARSHGIKL